MDNNNENNNVQGQEIKVEKQVVEQKKEKDCRRYYSEDTQCYL